MATDKMLKKTAIELNDVMGLTPPINTKGTPEELTKGIKAAMVHVNDDDEFSPEVQAVLDELKPKGKKAAEAPAPKKKAPVVEVEDDEVEVEEEEEVVAPPKKKKVVVVEEDDDDDEPAPAPKKKKAPVVEEDDDDDDDEPAPKKKVAAKDVPADKKKGAFVKSDFTRIDAIAIVLKDKKPKTLTEWATKANALYVSKGGKDNLSESKNVAKYLAKGLVHFDVTCPLND